MYTPQPSLLVGAAAARGTPVLPACAFPVSALAFSSSVAPALACPAFFALGFALPGRFAVPGFAVAVLTLPVRAFSGVARSRLAAGA